MKVEARIACLYTGTDRSQVTKWRRTAS